MKNIYLLSLIAFASLVGCSSQGDGSAQPVDPAANLPADQKIEKIQNDPNTPDGLKKIQIDTLRHQPDAKR